VGFSFSGRGGLFFTSPLVCVGGWGFFSFLYGGGVTRLLGGGVPFPGLAGGVFLSLGGGGGYSGGGVLFFFFVVRWRGGGFLRFGGAGGLCFWAAGAGSFRSPSGAGRVSFLRGAVGGGV